ncbi:hypothetical protein RchiOBHm_Chr1g0316481 [Rosa chinensis]|uniref:Uncharacterized protein n=1 Tax=Rosa chinensis TaxID=74649 RepID=A0A2P6S7M0_ROSCH|nr:hypothetical protein RchiOBHm_Chr1g0316481 [Rosa chinensis]
MLFGHCVTSLRIYDIKLVFYKTQIFSYHMRLHNLVFVLLQPLLSLFYAQPGNSLWKCKADAAFMHCTTMKSFFEETLIAIPDFVLDAPVGAPPSGSNDPFGNIHTLLPPPYESREQELQYASSIKS